MVSSWVERIFGLAGKRRSRDCLSKNQYSAAPACARNYTVVSEMASEGKGSRNSCKFSETFFGSKSCCKASAVAEPDRELSCVKAGLARVSGAWLAPCEGWSALSLQREGERQVEWKSMSSLSCARFNEGGRIEATRIGNLTGIHGTEQLGCYFFKVSSRFKTCYAWNT